MFRCIINAGFTAGLKVSGCDEAKEILPPRTSSDHTWCSLLYCVRWNSLRTARINLYRLRLHFFRLFFFSSYKHFFFL